jgi:hypothetical protein
MDCSEVTGWTDQEFLSDGWEQCYIIRESGFSVISSPFGGGGGIICSFNREPIYDIGKEYPGHLQNAERLRRWNNVCCSCFWYQRNSFRNSVLHNKQLNKHSTVMVWNVYSTNLKEIRCWPNKWVLHHGNAPSNTALSTRQILPSSKHHTISKCYYVATWLFHNPKTEGCHVEHNASRAIWQQ